MSKSQKPEATPASKLSLMVDLLKRPQGATIGQLTAVTGWQSHSVRGAMAGALKKKRGLTITSEKTDSGRVYRAATGAEQ